MRHEFYDCLRLGCYVSDVLTKKKYIAFWPQLVKNEKRGGFSTWQFYIEWRPGEGTHVTRNVCPMHHEQILALAEHESGADVREQEVTERWLTNHNSQILAQ